MTVPTLDSIVAGNVESPYSRPQFLAFLYRIHCVENLEFILELNEYLSRDGEQCPIVWNAFYNKYFSQDSTSEINLPYALKRQLTAQQCPQVELLLRAKKFIYEDILVNLYHEFVRFVKGQGAHEVPLEIVDGETLSDILAEMFETETENDIAIELCILVPQLCTLDSSSSSDIPIGRPRTLSRGSSIGSIMDTFKSNVDYGKFKMKFRRRFSNEA